MKHEQSCLLDRIPLRNSDVRESLEGVMLEVLAALGAVEKPEWNGE
jgi:hypothetical protein